MCSKIYLDFADKPSYFSPWEKSKKLMQIWVGLFVYKHFKCKYLVF